MNKTLHNKLTEKHFYSTQSTSGAATLHETFGSEMELLKEAAKELLQPRPQAIANLLKMAALVK